MDIENALNRISRNRLEGFSMAISCSEVSVPALNFHSVKDGAVMSLDCQLTTSRVSMNYNKAFGLTDQYIKNSCMPSN